MTASAKMISSAPPGSTPCRSGPCPRTEIGRLAASYTQSCRSGPCPRREIGRMAASYTQSCRSGPCPRRAIGRMAASYTKSAPTDHSSPRSRQYHRRQGRRRLPSRLRCRQRRGRAPTARTQTPSRQAVGGDVPCHR
jgi:hypothetical protein